MTGLPIADVLPRIRATLARMPRLVLVAPPGAGKTTAVPPALLDADWCTGELLLLSPRRLAARAAAERMAAVAGEPVGRTFGYATRMDSRRSAATRVTVMTEGIFRNRIQADPELAGVSAVLFDEVHERSLDTDVSLAFALDVQAALRPELRLVAMSATLDGARVAALMDGAPVIESAGRAHPLAIHHVGRDPAARIEHAVAAAIGQALAAEAEGDVLAFLPGVAEIERTAERVAARGHAGLAVHRLHGALDPAAQRAALAPAPPGTRKLILATAIAETSLTIDGVRIVVDSGLARRPRYDRAAGLTRLVTERVSQAAAAQRAGRAGRQAPGTVWRLWEEGATAGLPRFDPPEMLEADLSALVLDCAIWGVADATALRWLDPPPPAALEEARRRLAGLGAIDGAGRPTAHGRAMAALPLPPRLAHMLLAAGEVGTGETAAEVAVLLSERGLGGNEVDLETRRRRWRADRGGRAEAARALARRWAAAAGVRGQAGSVGLCVALAFPDRIARRRDASGESWILAGGRGARLDPASGLASEPWLAAAELSGAAAGARMLAAAAIGEAEVERLFADRIVTERQLAYDPAAGEVRATRTRRLGAIMLARGADTEAEPGAIAAALIAGVQAAGVAALPWPEAATALRARAAFAARIDPVLPDLSDAGLEAAAERWLPALLAGVRRVRDVPPVRYGAVLDGLLGWSGSQAIERLAPSHLRTPAGSAHPIDYRAEGGPRVELRPQALFGLAVHPIVGRGTPLVLALTSPAGRPIQTTTDLPGFWSGSWRAVAKEMRGRYPRHPWPDDPASATPTLRTKKAAGG